MFAGFNIISAGYFSAVEMAKESFVVSVLRGFVLMIGISITLFTPVWNEWRVEQLSSVRGNNVSGVHRIYYMCRA